MFLCSLHNSIRLLGRFFFLLVLFGTTLTQAVLRRATGANLHSHSTASVEELFAMCAAVLLESLPAGAPVCLLSNSKARNQPAGVYNPARVSPNQEGVKEGHRSVHYTADMFSGLERVVDSREQTFLPSAGRCFPTLIEVRRQTAHGGRSR